MASDRLADVGQGFATPDAARHEARRRTLHDVMELAAKFFADTLASRNGAKARGYLADRGITPATQLQFRLGYSPADRFALKEHLGKLGVSVEDMIETGLLVAGNATVTAGWEMTHFRQTWAHVFAYGFIESGSGLL